MRFSWKAIGTDIYKLKFFKEHFYLQHVSLYKLIRWLFSLFERVGFHANVIGELHTNDPRKAMKLCPKSTCI